MLTVHVVATADHLNKVTEIWGHKKGFRIINVQYCEYIPTADRDGFYVYIEFE